MKSNLIALPFSDSLTPTSYEFLWQFQQISQFMVGDFRIPWRSACAP